MEDTIDKADDDRTKANEAVVIVIAQASYDNVNQNTQVSPTTARSR